MKLDEALLRLRAIVNATSIIKESNIERETARWLKDQLEDMWNGLEGEFDEGEYHEERQAVKR